MLHVIYFIFIANQAAGEVNYNVTPVNSPILQEDLFDAYLYHEVWTTIHYVEIKDLKDQAYSLGNYIEHLSNSCKGFHTCNHEASIRALQARYKRI